MENATLVICNDDWATPRTDVPYLIERHTPLLWASQESKGENYRARLPIRYGVRQKMATAGTQGVAVGWDKSYVKARQGKGNHGWQFLVDNLGLEPRGVIYQDLRIGDWEFTLASSHRPPQRYKHLWPTYDERMGNWFADRKLPVVLAMDCNEDGGPTPLLKGNRHWYGHEIDGAVSNIPGSWAIKVLPKRSSDHAALLLKSETIERHVKR